MKIDTHVHFWNYNRERDAWISPNMQVLQKDFLPAGIIEVLTENEIDGVVAVQADQSETETLFLNRLAMEYPLIRGVVGWIDLQRNDIEERLQHFQQYPLIKGWRHIIQAEEEGFLLRENFIRGCRFLKQYNYTYDILIHHSQLQEVLSSADKIPGQKMVLDHCGKPGIKEKEITNWAQMIRELSGHNEVYCKLSGLLTEAAWNEWTDAELYPYLDIIFNCFGVNRIMYGSDWPVVLLSGKYKQWNDLVWRYMQTFSASEQLAFWGTNALAFYNLDDR